MRKLIDSIYTAIIVVLLFPLALGAWVLMLWPGRRAFK